MERETLRMALPSKGRMAEDTLQLLKVHMRLCNSTSMSACTPAGSLACHQRLLLCLQDCQLSVYKPNPRQYIATISQVSASVIGTCICAKAQELAFWCKHTCFPVPWPVPCIACPGWLLLPRQHLS